MKKAFAWLEGNGIEYQLHDYKKIGIAPEKVQAWLAQVPWEELVNTRGTTFRKLPPARQQNLDAKRAAALMVEAPSVIRRPVIEAGRKLLIGFDPDRYEAVLGKARR
jgi:Spx/MgsR family transcriptional regulator